MSDSYYLDSKLSSTSSFEDKEAIKNVSFVGKIHLMLKDPECIGHISWNNDGTQFFIMNIEKFSDQVLPRYFKHGNYASFVRILNKHGFHKIKSDAGEACFFHTHFKKNITNLAKVKRMNQQTAAVTYNTKRVQPLGTENRVSAEEFKECQKQLQEMNENFKTMEAKTGALKDLVTDQSKMISLICKEIAILTAENESKLNTLLSQLTAMKRTETIKKEEQELAKSTNPNEWQSQPITKGRSKAFLNQTVAPSYERKPTDPYNGQLLNEITADVSVLSYNRKSKGTSENFPEQASKYDREQEISDYYDLIMKKHKKESSPPINQKNGPGMPTSESSGDFFQTAVYGTNYDYDYYDEEHPYV